MPMMAAGAVLGGRVGVRAAVAGVVTGISEVTATTVDNSGGTFDPTLTVSHTHPSGSDLVLAFVGVAKAATGAFTSVTATYGGQAMTAVDDIGIDNAGSSRTEEHLFQLFDPPTGANDLVATMSPDGRTTVRVYSIDNATTLGAPATNTVAGDNITSVDLSVPSQADDLVLRGLHWRNSGDTITFGAGQTGVTDQGVNGQDRRAGSSWKRATGGPTAMPATMGGNSIGQRIAMVGVAVRPMAVESEVTLLGEWRFEETS